MTRTAIAVTCPGFVTRDAGIHISIVFNYFIDKIACFQNTANNPDIAGGSMSLSRQSKPSPGGTVRCLGWQ